MRLGRGGGEERRQVGGRSGCRESGGVELEKFVLTWLVSWSESAGFSYIVGGMEGLEQPRGDKFLLR